MNHLYWDHQFYLRIFFSLSYLCITTTLKGSVNMSIISVRTTDEEKKLIQEYSEFFGMTMSEFIKTSVVEKIEDLFDLASIESYEIKVKKGLNQSYSHEDIMKEFGLQ